MSTLRVQFCFFSAALVCLTAATEALAQQPALVYDLGARRSAKEFHKALDDPTLLSDDAYRTAFENYVTKYSITRLIDPNVESTKQLPEIRDRIKGELWRGPTGAHPPSGTSHDKFNELALKVAKQIALGDYKPVVRYNAVLLIGDLDKVQPTMRGRKIIKPGKPDPKALDLMLSWVGLSGAPEYVKAGLLRGIHRHARDGITGNQVGLTQTAMLKLLNEKMPPGKRTAKVHAWMRRRAADVLGAMKSAGNGNLVAKGLLNVMQDETEPILVRGTAAAALSQVVTAEQLKTFKAEIDQILAAAKAFGATAAATKAPAGKSTTPAPKP